LAPPRADPSWQPPGRCLQRPKHLDEPTAKLADLAGVVARLARDLVERYRRVTDEIIGVECEIAAHTGDRAPVMSEIPSCAALTAAKIVGETADIGPYSKARMVDGRGSGDRRRTSA
jgi:transposase